MKHAMDLDKFTVFKWQNDLYTVIRQENDTTIVRRIAGYWTHEKVWKAVDTKQEENFNPYCDVDVNFARLPVEVE